MPTQTPLEFAAQLCSALLGMMTSVESYEMSRSQAAKTLRKLSNEYALLQGEEAAEAAAAIEDSDGEDEDESEYRLGKMAAEDEMEESE